MAIRRTVKREATTDGAPTDWGGIGSPSLRTRILQPRFKSVANCKRRRGMHAVMHICVTCCVLDLSPSFSLQSIGEISLEAVWHHMQSGCWYLVCWGCSKNYLNTVSCFGTRHACRVKPTPKSSSLRMCIYGCIPSILYSNFRAPVAQLVRHLTGIQKTQVEILAVTQWLFFLPLNNSAINTCPHKSIYVVYLY